jgi:predicted DNA-binding ribbon-helix-helix protein
MESLIVKRSVHINGHKTSVSVEDAFWADLKIIAHAQQITLSALVAEIDGTREHGNLSSAIRLFVLRHIRNEGNGVLNAALRPDNGLKEHKRRSRSKRFNS